MQQIVHINSFAPQNFGPRNISRRSLDLLICVSDNNENTLLKLQTREEFQHFLSFDLWKDDIVNHEERTFSMLIRERGF